MTSRPDQFLAWPGWASIAQFLLLAVPVTAWWVIVYHGADWLAGQRAHRGHVHLDAELAIPFVPAFILVYLSLDLVFLPAPFILRSRRELEALALSLAAITGVAGICFVVFPAELAYPESDPGPWAPLFEIARRMALRYNLAPSLHVAMSALCLAAYGTHSGPAGKSLLAAWGAAIALSTLLTHQHHLLDVVTGLALAAAGKHFIYDWWRHRSPGERKPPANPACGQAPPA